MIEFVGEAVAMLGRHCQRFEDKVRSHFEFLFSEYGFGMEHLQEASAGERCLLVLQGQFRIKFLYGKGDLEVSVGQNDAPPSWDDKIGGVRVWLPIWGVLRYVGGEPKLNSAERMKLGERFAAMDTDSYLAEIANSMRPLFSGIAKFFGSSEFPEDLRRFEQYLYA
jgi:hypothetical protein